MLLFFSPHKRELRVGKTNMSAVSLTPLRPLKALVLLKMTSALNLPLCLFHYNEHACVPAFPSGGQSEGKALRILQAVWLMDSLTLTWSRRPVGTARLSTPRPYVSNQSVSLALNGTSATPASQAEHVSSLSALTAMPSPCN